MKKILSVMSVAAVLAASLTGCSADPIAAVHMVANPNVYDHLDKNQLTHAVSVGKVSVSPAAPTKGLVVTPEEFARALEISMRQAGWYADQNAARYNLSATFIGFERPFTMFSTKMFSEVKYTMDDRKTGSVVYQRTVKIPCVITMGEVYNATVRDTQTMMCSIRENVTHMMRDLNAKF